MQCRHPKSTLFPYTTLFRSEDDERDRLVEVAVGAVAVQQLVAGVQGVAGREVFQAHAEQRGLDGDRKSTRLNSSHVKISYAVFCLKKKTILNSINIIDRKYS